MDQEEKKVNEKGERNGKGERKMKILKEKTKFVYVQCRYIPLKYKVFDRELIRPVLYSFILFIGFIIIIFNLTFVTNLFPIVISIILIIFLMNLILKLIGSKHGCYGHNSWGGYY